MQRYTWIRSRTTVVPVSAGNGGGSQMWRYIRFKLVRQFYSIAFCCGAVAKFVLCLVALDCVDFSLTHVLLDLWVCVLLGASGSCVFPLTIPVVFELVLFDGVVRCVVVPVAGSHSKCAGLTRSNETTLPFIRISMTLPLLTMTLYGPSHGAVRGGAIAIRRKNTCVHVSISLYWKMFSGVCRAVGTNGDATWLRVAYLSNCPSLYVRRQYTSV